MEARTSLCFVPTGESVRPRRNLGSVPTGESVRLRRNLGVLAGAFALLFTTQCSSRYDAHCENQRSCLGGNDNDVNACIEGARATENIASAYGCDDQWDAFADCLEKVVCRDGRLDSSGCKPQGDALEACEKAASASGSIRD
jgi:hypothetical protein